MSLIAAAVAVVGLGCGDDSPMPERGASSALDVFLLEGPAFLAEAGVRRDALEVSLVTRANSYAQLRLAEYAIPGGWDDLPVRNFPVRPLTTDDFGRFDEDPYRATPGDYAPMYAGGLDWTHEALFELGRRAFHAYPLELSNRFAPAVADRESAAELGLWVHEGRVGGLMRARLDDGGETFATTCATCHASVVDGELLDGRTNPAIDNSAMSRRQAGLPGSDWGPGAADVTSDGASNPVGIPDLRPIAHQTRLHWAATLYNSPLALAVRVETLMITSANAGMRPPREVAFALAYYLWSLGEGLGGEPDPGSPGGQIFERDCAMCHGVEANTLDAVPLDMVGTDPAAGLSAERGTGDYRVPSLRGLGSRAQFLHEGRVKSLEEMFDPARLEEVPGHVFGTNLDDAERAELIEFLRTL